uniref:Uncharacterized protein n=1 Tax=Anguilla anguilla TaxID=7936 RepID=A0A0E9QL49_ANGAN
MDTVRIWTGLVRVRIYTVSHSWVVSRIVFAF